MSALPRLTKPDMARLIAEKTAAREARKREAVSIGSDVYPILPDIGEDFGDDVEQVLPSTDGRPWRKACDECAFLDPTQRNAYLMSATKSGRLFYCIHRQDEGHHRVCAGFAACRPPSALASEPEDILVSPTASRESSHG